MVALTSEPHFHFVYELVLVMLSTIWVWFKSGHFLRDYSGYNSNFISNQFWVNVKPIIVPAKHNRIHMLNDNSGKYKLVNIWVLRITQIEKVWKSYYSKQNGDFTGIPFHQFLSFF